MLQLVLEVVGFGFLLALLITLWFVAGQLRAKLGAWLALLGFLTMVVGYVAIALPLQAHGVIAGLWATEALAIALPAVAIVRGAGLRLAPYLGLRAVSPKTLLIAAVAATANQPVVSVLTWGARELLPHAWVVDFDQKQLMLDQIFRGQAWAMVATVVIAAPLGEELFFRGFALPSLSRNLGVALAAVISAALFSALHLDRIGALGLWEIGLLLAFLRIWSGSLWPAILAHAVNNAIAGGAFMLGYEDPMTAPPSWFLLLGGVLLLLGIYFAAQILRREKVLVRETPREGVADPGCFKLGRAGALWAIWLAAVVGGLGLLISARQPARPAPVELPPAAAPDQPPGQ